MKIVYEKKYILSANEKEIMDTFLSDLNWCPLPCQGCNAHAYGKCIAHTIWDDLDTNETCTEYIKWREKMRGIRQKIGNIEDNEFKKLIENKYMLNYTLQNVDKASVLYKMAETKEKKTSNINKVDVDYSYKTNENFVIDLQKDVDTSLNIEDGEFFDMPIIQEEIL